MEPQKKRMGRPPLPTGQAKDARIMVRLTPQELALLEAAAGGRPVSSWAHDILVAAARHVTHAHG